MVTINELNQKREIIWQDPTDPAGNWVDEDQESSEIELFNGRTIRSLLVEFTFENAAHTREVEVIVTLNNKFTLINAPLHILQLESMYFQDIETIDGVAPGTTTTTLFLNFETNPLSHAGALCNRKVKSVKFKVINNDTTENHGISSVRLNVNEIRGGV